MIWYFLYFCIIGIEKIVLEEKYGYIFYEEKIQNKHIFFLKTKNDLITEVIAINEKIYSIRQITLNNLKNFKISHMKNNKIPIIDGFDLSHIKTIFINDDNDWINKFFSYIHQKYSTKYKELFQIFKESLEKFLHKYHI